MKLILFCLLVVSLFAGGSRSTPPRDVSECAALSTTNDNGNAVAESNNRRGSTRKKRHRKSGGAMSNSNRTGPVNPTNRGGRRAKPNRNG